MASLSRSLRERKGLDNFEFVKVPLGNLLAQAKVLVVTESSAAIEGISLQCRVIIPRLANIIDMNPLSGVSDLPTYVESPEELCTAVTSIMQNGQSPTYYNRCRDFVESYCEFVDDAGEFLERLEKAALERV